MIPILYEATETSFDTFGIGALPDAISPHVVEERNGEFTFEMDYPVDGTNYDLIGMRSIIKALPKPNGTPQPFRVYRMTKPINGIVKIYARHIRYDLEGVPVYPFTSSSLFTALSAIKANMMVENPFQFYTDKTSSTGMTLKAPATTTSLMGGTQGSLLDIYGGEYEYDGFDIYLRGSRGQNTNVVIRYGVNLIDLEQEENCANVYTGVLAFWKSYQNDQIVSGTVQSVGTFDFTRIKLLDRSMDYENPPTQDQLNNDAVAYANEAKIGVPKVSINLKFVDLQQMEEYKLFGDTLGLCDLVTVEFEKLGVSTKAKIIRTDFDVINERYISLDIGDSRISMADTIIGISTKAESAPTATEMQQAITATTAAITGANGGAVRLLDTNADGSPDTLYIADNPDPYLASKVWRFNYEGWGASEHGYSGPFTMGATFLQGFIADFITAGTLNADRIGANTIAVSKLTGSITNGDWEIDLDNGTLTIGSISASEITSGTIDASLIAANSIAVSKLTGSITNGQWKIDLDDGTFTVGTISANNITAGTLDASNITVNNLNASNITTGTLNISRIGIYEITGGYLGNIAASTVVGGNVDTYTLTGGYDGNLAASTVAYGNTEFTGTLDQVGVNKSNIEAINGYFTGTANFNYAIISVLQASAVTLGGHSLYYSDGYVRYTT